MQYENYQALSTAFNDLEKAAIDPNEIAFYSNALKNAASPILDAMCGSGRLLLPLTEQGFQIEGIDRSHEMIASLQQRLSATNYNIPIYEDDILQHQFTKQYGAIFITVGSFQLINDRDQAFKLLKKFHDLLLPGGIVIVDNFIPSFLMDSQGEPVSFDYGFNLNPTSSIHLYSVWSGDIKQQQCVAKNNYQKNENGNIVAQEQEILNLTWYTEAEMISLMEKAGFKNISCQRNNSIYNPEGFIFVANKL